MLGLAVALLLGVIKLCNKSDKLVFFVAAGCLAIAAGKHLMLFYMSYSSNDATYRRRQEERPPNRNHKITCNQKKEIPALSLSLSLSLSLPRTIKRSVR